MTGRPHEGPLTGQAASVKWSSTDSCYWMLAGDVSRRDEALYPLTADESPTFSAAFDWGRQSPSHRNALCSPSTGSQPIRRSLPYGAGLVGCGEVHPHGLSSIGSGCSAREGGHCWFPYPSFPSPAGTASLDLAGRMSQVAHLS